MKRPVRNYYNIHGNENICKLNYISKQAFTANLQNKNKNRMLW